MAVLEEGNTLFGAGPGHCKGQTGVNHAIEARDRLINTELIVRLAEPADATLDRVHRHLRRRELSAI